MHTDRGSQYGADSYLGILEAYDIPIPVDRGLHGTPATLFMSFTTPERSAEASRQITLVEN